MLRVFKRRAFLTSAAMLGLFATSALAETTPELTREITQRASDAQANVQKGNDAFATGDVKSGCTKLAGAAHDLDLTLDLAFRIADQVENDHWITEETRSRQRTAVQENIRQLYDQRRDVQSLLSQQRCIA